MHLQRCTCTYMYKVKALSSRYMRCKNRDDTIVVGLPQTNPLGFRKNGISFCKPLYYDGQVLSDQTLCRRSNESKLKKKSDDHVLTNRHLRHFQCGPWRVRCVQCGHENGSCLEGSYGWLFGMRVGIRVKHVIKYALRWFCNKYVVCKNSQVTLWQH